MVPKLEPVLLDEVGVAGRLAHDLACGFLLVFDAERGGRADEAGARSRVWEAAELAVLEEPVGVGLGGDQPYLQVGQAGSNQRDGEAAAADRLEGDADGGQRGRVEVVHLVDQEERARAARLRDLADLDEQLTEVLLGIAGIGDARGGLDVELELDRAGHGDAERLDDAERALDAVLDAVLAAHLA